MKDKIIFIKESILSKRDYERYKLNDFIKLKYLIKDKQKSFYIYQQTDKEKSYIGIIAGISIDDYNNNIIKIHEETITKRENLFKKYQ